MDKLAESSKRLMATYRGEKTDRVPMCSPISWDPMQNVDKEDPPSWRADEDFREVARLVQKHCDPHPLYAPAPIPRVFARYSYQRFLEAPQQYVEEKPPEKITATRTRYTRILHAPKGDMTWAYDVDEGIETSWDVIKPIQSPADVENMLSVPYRFEPPPPPAFEAMRQYRAKAGRDAIGGVNVNSMVAMLCGVMSFERVLEWTLEEENLLKALADTWLARTRERIDYLMDQGVGPIWHFNGVERATPPMMGPRQWDQWVVPYDGEIMRQIKQRDPNALIHVHCHGRVGTLLKSMMAMGVDSTDPVEPPPQGDIDFAAAKKLVDGRMVLFGNVEFLDMETLDPNQIEEKVRLALTEGGKRKMVLYPSATPHERHSPKQLANSRRYIEAGLKYGAF